MADAVPRMNPTTATNAANFVLIDDLRSAVGREPGHSPNFTYF